MAQIDKFTQYILDVEGKRSSSQKDKAKKCYPAGVHTNKGITFCKWQKFRGDRGLDSSYEAFLNMSNNDYKQILFEDYLDNDAFKGFWKTYETRPVVAMFLIDWAFNRGNTGMEMDLAKWQREKMGIVDNNITIPEIFANIRNSNWSDHYMLLSLFYRRIKVYERIAQDPEQAENLPGWRNRVKRFYLRFAPEDVLATLRSQGVSFSGL